MGSRMLFCIVILLISSILVESRYNVPMNEESICESCPTPSTEEEEEKASSELKPFAELSMLSSHVCEDFPSDIKAKCLETSDAYVHRTQLLANGISNEEILCNSTGLCLPKSMAATINELLSLTEDFAEDVDGGACTACRTAVKDIFAGLNHPKLRKRVMEKLVDYCGEMEDHARECKRKIRKFAPLALSKLEQLKTHDFCCLMGFCGVGIL